MQRRTLLAVGAATGLLLALAGGGAATWRPARRDGRFTEPTRDLLRAVAVAVVADMLPQDAGLRASALQAHLERMEATVAGLAPATQVEVDELFALLSHPAGRLAIAGLRARWEDATDSELQATLQDLRTSSLGVRQQVYHALRDLTNAAYFAAPETWRHLGYPGPPLVGTA